MFVYASALVHNLLKESVMLCRLALIVCFALPLTGTDPISKTEDLPWATVTYPAYGVIGTPAPMILTLKPGGVPRNGKLRVDVHLFIGHERVPIGSVAELVNVTAGEGREVRVAHVVPDRPGISAMHYVFYISPDGGWNGNFLNGSVGMNVRQPPSDARDAPQGSGLGPLPMEQPAESVLSSRRAEIVLNGPWRFRPAHNATPLAEDGEWGQLWVPGSWKPHPQLPGLIHVGVGEAWSTYGPELASAWYERRVSIPASWQGRAIVLDLAHVSTDAVVYANGHECGRISWPGGSVDISAAVEAGRDAAIQVRVFAVGAEGERLVQMGTGEAGDFVVKAALDTRGITGDIVLVSRPRGGWIEDVFVQPSVTERRLACSVDLRGTTGGAATFTAQLVDASGAIARTFTSHVTLTAAPQQTVDLAWAWPDPRLWDVLDPHLYDLRLAVTGAGLDDEYVQRFGFREFAIQGTGFVLNERNLRLRPGLAPAAPWDGIGAVREAVDAAVAGMRARGFNILEIWPNDPARRGSWGYGQWAHWCEAADRHGMLLMAPAPHFPLDYNKEAATARWSAERGADYRTLVERHVLRVRNHPSIVLWGVNANEFFLRGNENPRHIGQVGWMASDMKDYRGYRIADLVEAGAAAIEDLRQIDPTRRAYTHHGGYVGPINTLNMYLNMIPLQEREDWLSHYAKHGQIPFIPIEFGTPVDATMLRSRVSNHAKALDSEPLLTEFCATYQGEASFHEESPAYRSSIRQRYAATDKRYHRWYDFWEDLFWSPNHLALQELFIRNTWRSWRAWGNAGGMLPWIQGYAVQPADGMVALPAFVAGRRGTWFPEMKRSARYWMDPAQGARETLAGAALRLSNGPTLAFIAGPPEEHTAKDHLFFAGETMRKSVAVINDEVHPAPAWTARWTATLAGQRIADGESSGTVASGTTLLMPFEIPLPIGAERSDGVIELEVRIGGHVHHDHFPYRIHTVPRAPSLPAVAVFDPEGTTSVYLRSLGVDCVPWDGSAVPMLVVGRNALSSEEARPGDLECYVRGGGRLLICNQDAAWTTNVAGLRTSLHVTRRAWPTIADHPITAGLDGEDFRDWRGAGTAYPNEIGTGSGPRWIAGWHWGNRGSVASSAPETPHSGSWRPLLQAGFDLMYAPLMEAQIGDGLAIWCALDLEGRSRREPMAAMVTARVFEYLATARPTPRAVVGYVGDEGGRELLVHLGISHAPAKPGVTTLVVAGPGANDAMLAPFAALGTPMVVLARQGGALPFGATLRHEATFRGSLAPPTWPETRGITAADLRFRSERPWHVLAKGCEIAADGLLGRATVGRSTVIYCQLDPEALDADRLHYFRYTRWRHQRVIANLLANLGASFASDGNVFASATPTISLPDSWRVHVVTPLPPAPSADRGHADPGISAGAATAVLPDFDDSGWSTVRVDTLLDAFATVDGEAVYRCTVEIPATLAGRDIELALGAIDDVDIAFWNGERIGATGLDTPGYWAAKRVYQIPGPLVKAGPAVIAVRVFDRFGGGGMLAGPGEQQLRERRNGATGPFYHPDYNATRWAGDDPARWCPW